MSYEDRKVLSESAARSTKYNKERARDKVTSQIDNCIEVFKKAYSNQAALIKRKVGKPFEIEFGYLTLYAHEEYEENFVSKKSGSGYGTSYSATVSSSGSISVDQHSDPVNYSYYGINSIKKEESDSVSFKFVKKGSSTVVKQKEAAFINKYSIYDSAYNGIDHKTKTVISPTPKLRQINNKKVSVSCVINLIMFLYLIYWSVVNLINNYYWFENNYVTKALPFGTHLFAFLVFFSIIYNLILVIHVKRVYIPPEKVAGIESRFELSSYYGITCIYYIVSFFLIVIATIGTNTSILYLLDMVLTLIIIIASVIKFFKAIKLCRSVKYEVLSINNCVSSTVTPEELLSSPIYENMVRDLNEICEYNMINTDTADKWIYDFESLMKGAMSAKDFVRNHPDFIIGADLADPDDPSLDYID